MDKKMRERLELIERLSKAISSTLIKSTKGYSKKIVELKDMELKKDIARAKHQRGYDGTNEFKDSILNDLVHLILTMEPICMFIEIPDGFPTIDIEDFFKNPKKYIKKGYRFCIADGSQRYRTIMGFIFNWINIPNLKRKDENSDKIEKVKNVSFGELPSDVQDAILNVDIEMEIYQGSISDFVDMFNKRNTNSTKLNDMEIYNNLYQETEFWQESVKMLKDERIINLFNLNPEKYSYDMGDVETDVAYIKKSDRGEAHKQLFKLMIHLKDGGDLNDNLTVAIKKFLEENSKKKKEDVTQMMQNFSNMLNVFLHITDNSYRIYNKLSMNRMRSVFAAVCKIEKTHPNLILNNIDSINRMFDEISEKLPVSQDGSGQKNHINREINMYAGLMYFICLNDSNEEMNIKNSLIFEINNVDYNIYEMVKNYYYSLDENKIAI